MNISALPFHYSPNYAANAYSYMVGLTSGKPRYTTWLSTYTSSYASTVKTHFSEISDGVFSTFTGHLRLH